MEESLAMGDDITQGGSKWWAAALGSSSRVDQMTEFYNLRIVGLIISEADVDDNETLGNEFRTPPITVLTRLQV